MSWRKIEARYESKFNGVNGRDHQGLPRIRKLTKPGRDDMGLEPIKKEQQSNEDLIR